MVREKTFPAKSPTICLLMKSCAGSLTQIKEPFVSIPIKFLGTTTRTYFAVFNTGATKFLVNYRRQHETNWKSKDARDFDGEYVTVERYYIRKGSADPIEIKLTTASLLAALPEKANQLKERLRSKKKLTKDEVIASLAYYDTLVIE